MIRTSNWKLLRKKGFSLRYSLDNGGSLAEIVQNLVSKLNKLYFPLITKFEILKIDYKNRLFDKEFVFNRLTFINGLHPNQRAGI